ncbi:hypothetical protein TNCV_1631691 [Trichonephila clavipes]|nr:hypothetical protein TNCV_1631691 [Trichonephila clavipes]
MRHPGYPSGHKWFSTLDLKSGYRQVEIHPEDRRKQHSLPAQRTMAVQKVMPFATAYRASYFRAPDGDRAKGSDFWKLACYWLRDDVLIGGRTFERTSSKYPEGVIKIKGR